MSDVYMEISRPFVVMRGVVGLMAIMLTTASVCIFYDIAKRWQAPDLESVFYLSLSLVLSIWCPAMAARFTISIPRDNPIRLNFRRQKIYAYNTSPNWLVPWKTCLVDVAVYNWAQVRAEYFITNRRIFSGEGIMLSIVQPGTNEVIDRFPLRFGVQDASLWNYICTYMQHGPCALPPFTTPRDANEVAPYNLFHRLAEKVKWPPEIDRESTTAP